ncbi:MAG TPA: hypothetical protein VGO58_08510 [Chitinophagaceae bacterium]|jgi:hypothetical protein|nr:hypothetical protein [Chitinophagaceae bacterium]
MQLTRWNYTKEEWRNFLHWKTRKKGLIFFLFQKLRPVKAQHIPEIKITRDTVWVNDVHEPFQNDHRQYKEINIREAGNINILEIHYEQAKRIRGINIPIPRGKLREAFEIQDRLDKDSAV